MNLFVLVLVGCLMVAVHAAPSQDERIAKLEFSAVTRELDLTSNLVKEKTTIVLENKDEKSVSSFLYTIPRSAADKLAYIGGKVCAVMFYLMPTSIVLHATS